MSPSIGIASSVVCVLSLAHHAHGLSIAPAAPRLARPRSRTATAIAIDLHDLRADEGDEGGENAEAALPATHAASAGAHKGGPLNLLWRFSRPHTMIGSALCIPALTLYAAPAGALLPRPLLLGSLYALPAALMMNLYITGLNQLLDIEIDKVNKPDLPLASGELTPLAGGLIVGAALAGSLVMGWWHPVFSTPALRLTLLGSALLGTIYSVPPFRLKRFPLLASVCIMSVRCARGRARLDARHTPRATRRPSLRGHVPTRSRRGALINWGFYTHAATLGAATGATASAALAAAARPLRCWGPVAFFTLFGMCAPRPVVAARSPLALTLTRSTLSSTGAARRWPPPAG